MAVPESVFLTNAEGYITFVNRAFTELTGFEPLDVDGLTPRILSSGMMPTGFFEELWATIQSGRQWKGRILNRRFGAPALSPDGVSDDDLYWVEASITPVFSDDGSIDGYITIQRDVTEEVQRERESVFAREAAEMKAEIGRVLQQQQPLEARFSRVLEMLCGLKGGEFQNRCAVLIVEPETRELRAFVAHGFTTQSKQPLVIPLGKGPCGRAALSGQVLIADECTEPEGEECRSQGEGAHGHYVLPMMHSGQCLGVICMFTKLRPSASPARLAMLAHVSDLLGMALAEERVRNHLTAARNSADEAARVKASFLANISHEIRTPMNGVIGMTQLLLSTELDEEQRTFARSIKNSGEALLALINDVLDFSKLEAGKMVISRAPTDVKELVVEVMELLSPSARDGDVVLSFNVQVADRSRVVCDALRVRQLLTNLVSNAIKFSRNGHVNISVEIEANRVYCEVADDGIGIDSSRLDSIFESFTQADISTVREFGGTGLGLTICKEIVELMGGELGVESEVGVGSKFWFQLPVEPAPELETPAAVSAVEELRGSLGLHVLVADDNCVNRAVATKMLEKIGCTFDQAVDGEEACAMVESGQYDAILMDVHMPKLDGMDATRRIRARMGDELPILAMTAMAFDDEGTALIDAGMNELIPKPVSLEALRLALSQYARE